MKPPCLPRCIPLPLHEPDCDDPPAELTVLCFLFVVEWSCITGTVADYSEIVESSILGVPAGSNLTGTVFVDATQYSYFDPPLPDEGAVFYNPLIHCLFSDSELTTANGGTMPTDAEVGDPLVWVEWEYLCQFNIIRFNMYARVVWPAFPSGFHNIQKLIANKLTSDVNWHLHGDIQITPEPGAPVSQVGIQKADCPDADCEDRVISGEDALDFTFSPQGTGCDLWDVPAVTYSITAGSPWTYTAGPTDYISAARLFIDNLSPGLQARLQVLYTDDPDNFESNSIEYTALIDGECIDDQFFGSATFYGSDGLCAYGGPGTDPVMVIDFTGPVP